MNTELIKCTCTVCSGHLVFDTAHQGETISCPHCGVDTVLFVPAPPSRPPGLGQSWVRRHRKLCLWIALMLPVLVGIVWALIYFLQHPPAAAATAEGVAGGIAGGVGLVVMIALVVLAALVAILWILFPVFVYFAIDRFETLLQEIERNTRKP